MLVVTSAIVGVIATKSAAGAADVTPFTVAIPTVTGPIPSTSTNFPYIADGFDVEPPVPAGYVEQEYFFSGTGNLYEYNADRDRSRHSLPGERDGRNELY